MQQELTNQSEPRGGSLKIEHCANCGADMQGAYCYRCGQASRHFIRFFPAIVREIIEDTLDIDGRFGRTIWTIMFRPGRATRDFLSGKRVHYTPPFRLYLFTSLLAFLMFSIEADYLSKSFEVSGSFTPGTVSEDSNTEAPDDISSVADNPDITPKPPAASDEAQTDDENDFVIMFGSDGEWDPVNNPIDINWLPASINRLFNSALSNIENNFPRIKENPGLLIEKVIQLLPQTLFLLLPIFAVILKFFYLFAKRYYMEHLIFSVHVHTFVLMVMIVVTGLDMLTDWLGGGVQTVSDILQGLLLLWIIVYLFIAQKRVYRQNWFFTFVKYNAVYFTYSILQVIAICVVIVIGAATL